MKSDPRSLSSETTVPSSRQGISSETVRHMGAWGSSNNHSSSADMLGAGL